MKKIYTIILGGCLAVNGALADNNALNSKLNPKAVRKAVSSFMTTMDSQGTPVYHRDQVPFAPEQPSANPMNVQNNILYKALEACLSKYVSKDGTYNTSITVKQFAGCCIKAGYGQNSCKKLIEDVVFEHNMLAGSMRPVPMACTSYDLENVGYTGAKLATAGHYNLINGAKRCVATGCVSGAYLARSMQPNRYGQSDGYCLKGENPWVLQDGKYVLKTDVAKQSASQQDEKTEQPGQQQPVIQSEQKTEFSPDALMVMDFYKQYCVGAGNLKCFRSETGVVTSSFECTTKDGVKHDKMSRDAAAVCNGTFVVSNNTETVEKPDNNAVSANPQNSQQTLVDSEHEQLVALKSDVVGLQVAPVSAEGIVPLQINTPELSREQMLATANNRISENTAELMADASKASEKTQLKLDALAAQKALTQGYIDAESQYDINDIDAAIQHAENVKDAQKDMAKLQREQERLEKKQERQEKQEERKENKEKACTDKGGQYKAGSCWCDSLILTGNMNCNEIRAKEQARQDKREASKQKSQLEKEKSNLQKQVEKDQKKIKQLQDQDKSNSKKY